MPLQYKDIDLDNKIIKIHKAVYFEHNQPKLKTTKNEDSRNVPIFNLLFDTLKNMSDTHSKKDYIFTKQNNDMMSETALRRKFESVIKLINNQIELENKKNNTEKEKVAFTPHTLRHTYICILHKAGIDIKQAQLWAGHRDIKVLLNIYTHLDSQDNQNSIDKVNQFLG